MPTGEEIQRSLTGAWRLMTGRADGLQLLDISADGFWNSFFAVVVALPAFILGWVAIAGDLAATAQFQNQQVSVLLRLAVVDLAAWLVPIAGLMLVAGRVGIGTRLVHYVVASNWASAIIVWMMLVPSLMRLLFPGAQELAAAVSLALFITTLVLSWRLTNAVIQRGPGVATAVFAGMATASLVLLFLLQDLLGLAPEV